LPRPADAVVDLKGFGFEEAARTAVEQWHYEPALFDGEPVAVLTVIVVEFTLHLPPT